MEDLERIKEGLLPRYRLDRVIGEGGAAQVFLAEDLREQGPVAIKVLRKELLGSAGADRFLNEILLEEGLRHPNILPIQDSGEVDGTLYYVMPFVEGESLRDLLDRERQLPVSRALDIALQVAQALSYAHGQGVVHRDIKPGNILLSGSHAQLADFGLARALQDAGSAHLTRPGFAVGTPLYMSPEQSGGTGQADHRSDIYSLGCVLYEMLSGSPPFPGSTSQTIIARHLGEKPPPLGVVRPNLSPSLVALVDRALEKIPADRFQTAEEMISALEKCSEPSPPGGWEEEKPVGARFRLPLTLVSAIVLIAVIIGIWRGRDGSLDPNRIVGFPLVEMGGSAIQAGTGETIGLLIGKALQYADPLQYLDGWRMLSPGQKENIRLLTEESARGIARGLGAKYILEGSVAVAGDSTTLMLSIVDARSGRVAIQRSRSARRDERHYHELAQQVLVDVLAAVVDPGRQPDLSPISDRDAGAVVSWLHGERAYRNSHFHAASAFFRQALAQDSLLVWAALRGAEAATWVEEVEGALDLGNLAVRNIEHLPERHQHYAEGLVEYLNGQADSAVASLRTALEAQPDWPEAWMALGEVYYHLLPRDGPLDSLAYDCFSKAVTYDPAFTPPNFHLAEFEILDGDLAGARARIARLREADPDIPFFQQIQLVMECASGRGEGIDWAGASTADPSAVANAARFLARGGRYPVCAERGLRTVLGLSEISVNRHWAVGMTLQSLLVAEERYEEAEEVVDGILAAGIPAGNYLFVLDALTEGAPPSPKAEGVISYLEERAGEDFRELRSGGGLWALGVWYHGLSEAAENESDRSRALDRLGGVSEALRGVAAETGQAEDRLLKEMISIRLALAESLDQADTLRVIARLRELAPTGDRLDLSASTWQPLAEERLVLARLLLASGDSLGAYREAKEIESLIAPISLLYLRPSLEFRYSLASKLGLEAEDRLLTQRLRGLCEANPAAVCSNPPN